MPFEVPSLPVASSSKRALPASLVTVSALARAPYTQGGPSSTRLPSSQLGQAAGYEEVIKLGGRKADHIRRSRANKKAANQPRADKGKGKAKAKPELDDDMDDPDADMDAKRDGAARDEDGSDEVEREDGDDGDWWTEDQTDGPQAENRQIHRRYRASENEGIKRAFRRGPAFMGDMDYLENPHPLSSSLPSSSLLNSIANYATTFYSQTPSDAIPLTEEERGTAKRQAMNGPAPPTTLLDEEAHTPLVWTKHKRRSMWMELDGDSLIALGILMEEHVKYLVESSGLLPPPISDLPAFSAAPASPTSSSHEALNSGSASSSSSSPPAPTQQTVMFDLESSQVHHMPSFMSSDEEDEAEQDGAEGEEGAGPTMIQRPMTSAARRVAKQEEDRRERRKRRGTLSHGEGRGKKRGRR